MLVLLTGMSGVGKSTLVAELRRRGYLAVDADEDGYGEPRCDGRYGWRVEAVRRLFDEHRDRLLFFAGCSEEQTGFRFDLTVLLTVPEDVLVERLRTRTSNRFGASARQRAMVLADRREVEPLLWASADLVLETTRRPAAIAASVLRRVHAGSEPR